jgi:glycosyltransferase involved in cell wall biosynthesis
MQLNSLALAALLASASSFHISVEGWRSIPHSYAVVNQFQLLELVKNRPDITISVVDRPFPPACEGACQHTTGLFSPEQELILATLPQTNNATQPDAILRMAYPLDLTDFACDSQDVACSSTAVFVFGTTERKVPNENMKTVASPAWEAVRVRILTPSFWSAQGFYEAGVHKDQVTVLPHGVDADILKPASANERQHLRSRFGWTDDFIFLSVCSSRLEEKGVPDMISAFQAISSKHPQAKLVLKCLKGKGVTAIQARVDPALLRDRRIMFMTDALTWKEMAQVGPPPIPPDPSSLPPHSSSRLLLLLPPKVYTAADAYLSAYRAEGFNIPVLEAAACGLLIIATAGGATDEFLHADSLLPVQSSEERVFDQERKPLGRMLRPDATHLQSQMVLAMYDDGRRKQAAVAGPIHVRQGYTWTKVVDALVKHMKDAAAAIRTKSGGGGSSSSSSSGAEAQGRVGSKQKQKSRRRQARKARVVVEVGGAFE